MNEHLSSSEWQEGIKEGYRTKVIQVGNCTVTIHRPTNLTDMERRTIEDQIRISMLNLTAEKDTTKKEIEGSNNN